MMRRMGMVFWFVGVAACGSNIPSGVPSGGNGTGTTGTSAPRCDPLAPLFGTGNITVSNNTSNLTAGAAWSFSGDINGVSGGYNSFMSLPFVYLASGDTSVCPSRTFSLHLYGAPAANRSYKMTSLNDLPTDGSATLQYRENAACHGEWEQLISGWGANAGTAKIDSWNGEAIRVSLQGVVMSTSADVMAPGGNRGTGGFTLDGVLQKDCVK